MIPHLLHEGIYFFGDGHAQPLLEEVESNSADELKEFHFTKGIVRVLIGEILLVEHLAVDERGK
jgi:hypothetical protein